LRWLRFLGRLRKPLIQQHPCTNLISAYLEYMERDKGLSLATIKLESYYVKDFHLDAINHLWFTLARAQALETGRYRLGA